MKTKIILFFLAVFLPLSVFIVNADEKKQRSKIPFVNGNQKCSDFGNSECSIFGIKTTVLFASAVQ